MNDRDRFDKFTERARKVLSYAQTEAQRFNHHYIGTEHLLLGLLRATDGIAARALTNLGVGLEQVRQQVELVIGRGDRLVLGEIGLTPRSKKMLELAVDEARRLNQHYIGTEHILLGLVREGEGIAAGALESLGVSLEKVRSQVMSLTLAEATRRAGPAEPQGGPAPCGVKSNVVTCRLDDAALGALDALVEAGVRSTRSDAAAWLIAAGIESHRAVFEQVNATVAEIRRLRAEAQTMAEQVLGEAERAVSGPEKGQETESPPPTPPEDEGSEGDEGPTGR